jgi:hypothetical protein
VPVVGRNRVGVQLKKMFLMMSPSARRQTVSQVWLVQQRSVAGLRAEFRACTGDRIG